MNVIFDPNFYSKEKSDSLFEELQQISFFTQSFNNEGVQSERKIFAFTDLENVFQFVSAYAPTIPWCPSMRQLRKTVEHATECNFNYAMVNIYSDETLPFFPEKDDENELDSNTHTAYISLGATQSIVFKKPNFDPLSMELPHGSICVMLPPTNEIFTHEISAEPKVKETHITIKFMNILQKSKYDPSLKKLRYDENDPSLDKCMEEFCKKMDSVTPLLNHWNLGNDIYAYAISNVRGVHIYIREFEQTPDEKLFNYHPSSHYVKMSSQTWSEFIEKFIDFNTAYIDASFIANNQLIVLNLNGRCHFQQLYSDQESVFFKSNYLKLKTENSHKLCDQKDDINDHVIEGLLLQTLPLQILQLKGHCTLNLHCSEDEARLNFFQCVFNELIKNVNRLYKCNGCIFDDPSQRKHACLNVSDKEKYHSVGAKCMFYMNMQEIVMELLNYCSCIYTMNFFQTLSVEDFTNFFDKCLV